MALHAAIDVGNTTTKIGLFDGSTLQESHVFDHDEHHQVSSILNENKVEHAILSSVIGDAAEIRSLVEAETSLVYLDADTVLPIKSQYKTRETLGTDRIAAVVGASVMYPNENNLVIDAGTCITYDLIDNGDTYIGGNISPGLEMRLKAMHHYTGTLPLLKADESLFDEINADSLVGSSTKEAMIIGVKQGITAEIERIIEKLKKLYEDLNILLSGGDVAIFERWIKIEIFAVPNIVLIGLNAILFHQLQENQK